MRFQRGIQTVSLIFFLFLMTVSSFRSSLSAASDLFLRMDPVIALITSISARHVFTAFIPALLVILSCFVAGRFFCGYICPMGTTLDGCDHVTGFRKKHRAHTEKFRILKYLILLFLTVCALAGISYVFSTAPLSLITRLYGLVIQPIVAFLIGFIQTAFVPLSQYLGIDTLVFTRLSVQNYETGFFVFGFFILLLFASRHYKRFWCRYLCPAGAILALVSLKPILRRSVSEKCVDCGLCSKTCPMKAIPVENHKQTQFMECIVCRTCEKICPENAVTFGMEKGHFTRNIQFAPERRKFIYASLAGAGTALISFPGINSEVNAYVKESPAVRGIIRPPGSLPEKDFLARCIRCGLCMVACPTHVLRPVWFQSGFPGLFSPALFFKRGFCNPECHQCANVCPTDVIRRLDCRERIWAKTGTAVINKKKCIAWEEKKRCMVCDEVCPYKAVQFTRTPENPVAVPRVLADKCAGCGYCEHFCPVKDKTAIFVIPDGALRLTHDSYIEKGKAMNLDLSIKKPPSISDPKPYPDDFAPGFLLDE